LGCARRALITGCRSRPARPLGQTSIRNAGAKRGNVGASPWISAPTWLARVSHVQAKHGDEAGQHPRELDPGDADTNGWEPPASSSQESAERSGQRCSPVPRAERYGGQHASRWFRADSTESLILRAGPALPDLWLLLPSFQPARRSTARRCAVPALRLPGA